MPTSRTMFTAVPITPAITDALMLAGTSLTLVLLAVSESLFSPCADPEPVTIRFKLKT